MDAAQRSFFARAFESQVDSCLSELSSQGRRLNLHRGSLAGRAPQGAVDYREFLFFRFREELIWQGTVPGQGIPDDGKPLVELQ